MQLINKFDWIKFKKSMKEKLLIIVLSILLSILSIFFYRYYDFATINSNYLKSNDINELYDISKNEYLILDLKAYDHFQNSCIGNDASFLAQYGEIYIQGGLKCYSKDSITILNINGIEKEISNAPSSYFNVIDDLIYFRNDNDFKLYSYNIKSEKLECLTNEKIGQLVVSTKGISYISLLDKTLNYNDLNDKSKMKISDKKIIKYYVVGNKYLCLTTDSKLVLLDSKKCKVIDSNVEDFVYNGNLVIQKGSNLYLYKTFKDIEKITLNGNNQIQTLMDNKLYYVNYNYSKAELNQYDLITGSMKKIESIKENTVIKGCYFSKEDNVITLKKYN